MSIDHWVEVLMIALIFLLIVMGIRYLYISISHRIHHPEQWTSHRKKGLIPPEILKVEKTSDDQIRLYNLWFQIQRLSAGNVPGDFAELGVYKGDSAYLIHHLAPSRTLHLFDTFSGFFEHDLSMETGEATRYSPHDFADTDTAVVLQKLGNSDAIVIHEGYFPETTKGLESHRFALVNIDADLYLPVKAGLEFFYPRLSPGGVILIHDYTHRWEGLMKAVDDFVAHIPENLVHVPDRFGTVMIIRNKWMPKV
jgi:O-methyltransferase